jgi:hypothetical protein
LNGVGNDGKQQLDLANWTRAVTGIAFGGLVPQSSSNLAQAVRFTVGELHTYTKLEKETEEANRKEVEKLIHQIEELINKIQTCDSRGVPSQSLRDKRKWGNSDMPFGEYVAERAPSEESIDNVYYAIPLNTTIPKKQQRVLPGTWIFSSAWWLCSPGRVRGR